MSLLLNPNQINKAFTDFTGLGDIVSASDFILKVTGSDIGVLVKGFPIPYTSAKGEKEIFMRHGLSKYQPQNKKIAHTGGINLQETENGHLRRFLEEYPTTFNANVILGTEESPRLVLPIQGAFITLENPDADIENMSAGMQISGTIFFTYLPYKVGRV